MAINNPDLTIPGVVERFLRYVRIDTQSDPTSKTAPSTEKQKHLAKLLAEELKEIGVDDVEMDQYGYVLATIPGTLRAQSPDEQTVLALLAHMDTAPDESGANVRPIVHPPYDGSIIELPGDPTVKLDPGQQPALLRHRGEHLITSDGTTLLGSDDKAGIAILIQFAEDILQDSTPRPTVRLCFTIDEEIGRGVDHLDLEKLGASVAYTLDGSGIDTISFETFNAARAYIKVTGRSVHPGYAKGVLVNAVRILAEIISSLPEDEAPETTEDREGYYHAHTTSAGDVTASSAQIIVRDFSESGLLNRKEFVESLVAKKRQEYPGADISLEITDQYKNMRSYIEELDIRTVEFAFEAASDLGIDLEEEIVRGGTDGARLSEKGLPTPNVFNGGYDYHSRFEWNTVENLEHSLAYTKALVHCWGRHLNSSSEQTGAGIT
ncbi:MAG: peptidase T [Rhodothermia bacterium]|nr:MAG: peptidase T [Rhodothermia bacterium]